MATHDDRDDERDWPEDELHHPTNPSASEQIEPAEREDDAAPLPVRHLIRRRPAQRRRGNYRPPSELDDD